MKAVLAAIKTKFAVAGLNLYLGEAPQSAMPPYAIYCFINGAPDDENSTFDSDAENIEIQFSIWATTGAQALDFQTAFHGLYESDGGSLVVAGYDSVRMKRNLYRAFPDGDLWQAVTTYELLIEK